MSQSNMKLAAASAVSVSPNDDGAWYGGQPTRRASGPAPRGSHGARSVPPPPPAAAIARHTRGPSSAAPRLREPAFQLPAVPLPSSADSDWSALSSSHFGSSLRPPEKPGVNWTRVSAIGLSAAALVGGLYGAILLDSAHRAQISESRALHLETLQASMQQAPALPRPAEPPSALAAIGPISVERDRPAVQSGKRQQPAAAVASAPGAIEPAAPLASAPSAIEPAAPAERAHAEAASVADEPSADAATSGGSKSASRRHARAGSRDQSEADATPPSLAVKPLAAASPENLPQQLTREQVMSGLESVRAALAMCIVPAHGTTYANITIANTGRVTYSQIEGAFAGTPQGSCMARVLRGASFPRFASDSFKVRYPFAF